MWAAQRCQTKWIGEPEVRLGPANGVLGRGCIPRRRVVESGMDTKREAEIKLRFEAVSATADERTRRRLAGAEAKAMGRGGIAAVARATGLSPNTVRAGIAELEGTTEPVPEGRTRRRGVTAPPGPSGSRPLVGIA